MRTWIDELGERLERVHEPGKARRLLERYRDAFSQGYRESYSPETAVADIRVIEGLTPARPLGVDFHRRAGDQRSCVGLKVWSCSDRSRSRSASRCWRTWASGWWTSVPT